MKTYYNKQGKPVIGKHFTRLDDKTELNPAALTAKELAETCGLYTYETSKLSSVETYIGKIVFDEKKGTCMHEKRALTAEEIVQRKADEQEAMLRAEFEAEQENEKEEKYKEFKKNKLKIS